MIQDLIHISGVFSNLLSNAIKFSKDNGTITITVVEEEKAAKGKIVKSVFWHTIVGTNSKEKQGYATQKPIAILKPFIEVSSNPGDLVLDPFAGAGSLGEACGELNRQFIMIDNNPQAFEIMKKRLSKYNIQTSQ